MAYFWVLVFLCFTLVLEDPLVPIASVGMRLDLAYLATTGLHSVADSPTNRPNQ